MGLTIRNVVEDDLDTVLALNNTSTGGVQSMSKMSLHHFFKTADYFRVVEINETITGFLIGLREYNGNTGDSFLWFKHNHDRFLFIDRIVVANTHHRHGLGRIFYSDIQSFAEPRVPMLACAVTLEPRDDAAILFHGTYGFNEIAQQTLPNGQRTALMSKHLNCHAFVKRHYGSEDQLPSVPWLGVRSQPDNPAQTQGTDNR